MSILQEYISSVQDLQQLVTSMVIELFDNPKTWCEKDKDGHTLRICWKLDDLPELPVRYSWKRHTVEIWVANGQDSLSVGLGDYSDVKIDIPENDQADLWLRVLDEMDNATVGERQF